MAERTQVSLAEKACKAIGHPKVIGSRPKQKLENDVTWTIFSNKKGPKGVLTQTYNGYGEQSYNKCTVYDEKNGSRVYENNLSYPISNIEAFNYIDGIKNKK